MLINVAIIVLQIITEQGKYICENFGLLQKEVYGRLEFRNKPTTSNAKNSTISALLNRFECQIVSENLINFTCPL